ncbi:hypothetical protein GGI24_003676 [Coemansia furcata]|nr:hypothetical protein GGI24_003676 [Coemansia furcata]
MDLQSTDLLCRSPDLTAAVTPYEIEAGKNIRLTWANDMETSPYKDVNPNGPCVFWIAPIASKGVGKVWSKIHEYVNDRNEANSNWCTQSINQNGWYDFAIPSDIPTGKYILRSELIDITNAYVSNYDDFTMGPRFYPGCIVISVTKGGSGPLKNPVSILDVYKPYNKKAMFPKEMKSKDFVLPGPAPYTTGKVPA